MQIAESVKPPAFVTAILRRLAYLFPTLKLVPTKDITDLASKNGEYKKKVRLPDCCHGMHMSMSFPESLGYSQTRTAPEGTVHSTLVCLKGSFVFSQNQVDAR